MKLSYMTLYKVSSRLRGPIINTKFPTISSYPPFMKNPWKTLRIRLDNCNLKRSLESIDATVANLGTLTHLETTFSMLDRITNVSSLAVNTYLGLTKLCSPLHMVRVLVVSMLC